MDKKLLEFLKNTLRPDQAELMVFAEGFAEYCEDNPSIPSEAVEFLNKLCSQFPFLIKRPDFPTNPDKPPIPPPPLTREQLHFILGRSYRSEPQSEQDLQEDQDKLNRLNKRKSCLLHVKKCLEKHILEMRGEKARLQARSEQAADRTEKVMVVLTMENERFNELAKTMVKQIDKLKFYLDPNGADPPVFLSFLPIDEFLEAQLKYTSELNRFSQMAFSKDLSEFSDKNKAADIFSQDPESLKKLKSEILQVQSMKSLSLMKKIRLDLKLAELKAKNECLKEWKEKVEKAKLENDTQSVFKITRGTDEEVREHEEKFREECKKIPEMIEKIALGEISELFDREMKRKVAVQEQMLERQEQLIHFLKYQCTMFKLLTHLYQAEMDKIKELSEALKSIKSLLEEASRTSQLLEEHCKGMGEFPENTPRLIIPSSDKATHALYRILGLENKSRFPTYQVLSEAITSLQVKICASQRRNECVQETNLSIALVAEQKLKEARDRLSGFEQQAEQLVDGTQGRHQLEELLHEFELKMKEVLHTVSSKKQELLQHPTHALERRMAPAFYTDKQLYSQLKHEVDSIKDNQ